ncbi:hypothetical protein Avbf_00273 [Armadillidium vulgare]|nr:hypothetical protein Avbf_00273 [Armadillidium vulgare]
MLIFSPRFSASLMGITNTIATIPGFVSPAITGAITNDNNTIEAWRIMSKEQTGNQLIQIKLTRFFSFLYTFANNTKVVEESNVEVLCGSYNMNRVNIECGTSRNCNANEKISHFLMYFIRNLFI